MYINVNLSFFYEFFSSFKNEKISVIMRFIEEMLNYEVKKKDFFH